MPSRKILTYALLALPASRASARSPVKGRQQSCEAELLVDDFTQWEEGLNLLDGAAGRTSFLFFFFFNFPFSHLALFSSLLQVYSPLQDSSLTDRLTD